MSKSIEDYLKGIYTLKSKKIYSNKNLAEYLNISPASVSEMIKKLEKENYLTFQNKNIILTEKGEAKAKSIVRRHRVWEVFLVEKLHYEINETHAEAELLEHVTSDKLLRRLEKFLFYPNECPHGSPIIYDYSDFSEKKPIKLSELEVGSEIIIWDVENNIDLYDYLKFLNVKIKEEYIIERKDPFDGSLYLKNNDGITKVLAYEATKLIKVYKK